MNEYSMQQIVEDFFNSIATKISQINMNDVGCFVSFQYNVPSFQLAYPKQRNKVCEYWQVRRYENVQIYSNGSLLK